MHTFSDQLTQLVVDRIFEEPEQSVTKPYNAASPESGNIFEPELPGTFDLDAFGGDSFVGLLEADLSDEPASRLRSAIKRKAEQRAAPVEKRPKSEFSNLFDDLDCCNFLSDCGLVEPEATFPGAGCGLVGLEPLDPSSSGLCEEDRARRACSVDSSEDSCGLKIDVPEGEGTAEYHFEQIQKHARLAIAALQRGRYSHSKSLVTWAHDIKNKTAHEVKKAAEQAWETDKDRDRSISPKPAAKKNVLGSTKRVEQFRKNMRRWMIGTQVHQIGVEWMVYARMEHLVAISKFILGDALPADPASSSAVADSVNKRLGLQLPHDFIEGQLAEPEPGKRYAIGQELVPFLQAEQPRKVPTLAFSMPPDGDAPALRDWVAQLKALFPKKPAPKTKAASKPT